MTSREFFNALDEFEKELRIPKEQVIESLEAGLVSAFKKENGYASPISVILNEEKGEFRVYAHRLVVEELEDDDAQITLEEAQDIKPDVKVGDTLIEDITPKDFSRIAAMTAKQVLQQRINDIKRDMILSEMSERTGEIVTAVVRRKEGANVFVEISGTQMEGIMMLSDQIPKENYNVGSIIKVYIKKIRENERGAQVIVSRSAPGFVKKLLELEVPEIKAGLVRVVNIAREAGYRTKISVESLDQNIDAIGSCIGNKGVRINSVVQELGGSEKVDIIEYTDDIQEYVCRSISPATVQYAKLDEQTKTAHLIVPDDKLSLAIGKNGQNARLAARLTGWKVDVKGFLQSGVEV